MNFKDYKLLPLLITVLAGLTLIVASQIRNDQAFLRGIFLGYVMCLSNILFLLKILVKIFDQNYKRTSIIVLLFTLKMALIAVLFYLAFWVVHVNSMGFVLGYASMIPAVFIFTVINNKKAGKRI